MLTADEEPAAAPAADEEPEAAPAAEVVFSAPVSDDELPATGTAGMSLMLLAGLLLLAGAGSLRLERRLRFE